MGKYFNKKAMDHAKHMAAALKKRQAVAKAKATPKPKMKGDSYK